MWPSVDLALERLENALQPKLAARRTTPPVDAGLLLTSNLAAGRSLSGIRVLGTGHQAASGAVFGAPAVEPVLNHRGRST